MFEVLILMWPDLYFTKETHSPLFAFIILFTACAHTHKHMHKQKNHSLSLNTLIALQCNLNHLKDITVFISLRCIVQRPLKAKNQHEKKTKKNRLITIWCWGCFICQAFGYSPIENIIFMSECNLKRLHTWARKGHH